MATAAPGHKPPPTLSLIRAVSPPSTSRAWQTSPHPFLPLIATASSDKAVRIYSLTSFTQLSTITGGHTRSIRTCAWKPGIKGTDLESTLATGSFDASAGIWKGGVGAGDAHDGGRAERVADGEDDVADDDDDEAEDFRFAVLLDGHDSEIKSVAWSCNGTYLATCSRDKSLWIWEALDDGDDNYETLAVLTEHEGDVKCVAWHPSDEGCLASSSYDEAVRVWREDADGEWECVALLEGHQGTVWYLVWEPASPLQHEDNEEAEELSGPRIISCSDDLSIRVWRRIPKAKPAPLADTGGPRIRSIIRSSSDEEEWEEEARLPQRHGRAVYAVAWSSRSKRVVSCGSDGKIVVYEERTNRESDTDTVMTSNDNAAQEKTGTHANGVEDSGHLQTQPKSEWVVVAEIEAAHGVYEVNHVCWAERADKGRRDGEEVIVSTGDDGNVKVWSID